MTDKELKLVLNNMEIIIDSREQENSHIIDVFKKQGIPYVVSKLDTGDYSFIVKPVAEINFEGANFRDLVVLERKGSITELSGNIAQERERFCRELQRAKDGGMDFTILVEDGSFENIIEHKYRTNLNEKSFIASLLTFKYRYGISIEFIPKKYAGAWIYRHLYYYARNYFKEKDLGNCPF